MRKKKGTVAETMLAELKKRYPDGATTGELAATLYGKNTLENRIKVPRTARTLRKWGFRAYAFGGVYSLCDHNPEKLVQVFSRSLRGTHGWALSTEELTSGIEEAGDAVKAREARRELKKTLWKLANSL